MHHNANLVYRNSSLGNQLLGCSWVHDEIGITIRPFFTLLYLSLSTFGEVDRHHKLRPVSTNLESTNNKSLEKRASVDQAA